MLEKYENNIRIIVLDKLTYAGNIENIQEEITSKKIDFVVSLAKVCKSSFLKLSGIVSDSDFFKSFRLFIIL
jgi:dTDP-D-glucose 4,6-dehydratase